MATVPFFRDSCQVITVSEHFDDILHFEMPELPQIVELLQTRLGPAASRDIAWSDLADCAKGLSFADVARVANDVLKDALVEQRARTNENDGRNRHFILEGVTETEAYRYAGGGGGDRPDIPARSRRSHAAALRGQLDAFRERAGLQGMHLAKGELRFPERS